MIRSKAMREKARFMREVMRICREQRERGNECLPMMIVVLEDMLEDLRDFERERLGRMDMASIVEHRE